MPKKGILKDYDLEANLVPSAKNNVCITCGADPITYQWSDYNGEGMCTRCGTPYQLKWGSDDQEAEGAYPYLNLKEKWVPVVRRYFEETGKFAHLGMKAMGNHPSMVAFFEWVKANNAAPEA